MPTCWMFTDEFSSGIKNDRAAAEGLTSGQELEYREIEEWLAETVPGVSFTFTRDVHPHKLAGGCPDLYVFDWGGLCYVDHSGTRRGHLGRYVFDRVRDYPSCLFIPWTGMTGDYIRVAVLDFFENETGRDDLVLGDCAVPPNLAITDKSTELRFSYAEREELFAQKVREWFQK